VEAVSLVGPPPRFARRRQRTRSEASETARLGGRSSLDPRSCSSSRSGIDPSGCRDCRDRAYADGLSRERRLGHVGASTHRRRRDPAPGDRAALAIHELVMNLDDVIPNPRYRMCHSRVVGAPPSVVWDELHRVTMSALPLGWALEAVRLLPGRLSGRKHQPLAGRSFLDVTPIPVVFSEQPDVVISAGLSQAWRLLGGSTPPQLDATALRAWSQPGWIKVGMEFRLEPIRRGTLLSTETRVLPTDPRTRRAFATYWFCIRGSSGAIRREVLRVVAHRAELQVA
jgi:hypothetical protein